MSLPPIRPRHTVLPGACLLLMSMPSQAHALYLDPGTGSLILQVILAAGLTAWFTTKTYAQRLKGFIGRLMRKNDTDPQE